jgi:hypothetical protein
VQQQTGNTSGGNSVTATFSPAPTQNNLLIARAFCSTNNRNWTMNSAGWTQAVQGPGQRGIMFYKIAGASEAANVQLTVDGATTNLRLNIDEYEGIATASPLDRTASNTIASGSTTGSSGTTAATTVANALAVGMIVLGGSTGTTTPSFSNGFTSDHPSPGDQFHNQARKILSATGAQETTMTWVTARAGDGLIAVFKGGSAPPPPPPPSPPPPGPPPPPSGSGDVYSDSY